MPKATYMYWQKRFNRENPDKEIEEKILASRECEENEGSGATLLTRRKFNALCKNLVYRLHHLLVKVANTALTKVKLEPLHQIE